MFQVAGSSSEHLPHLLALLRGFDTATLVTRSRVGGLHGRPLSIARVDDDVSIWFVTSAASAKAEELAEDPRSMVTLQDASRFACLNGSAELVRDQALLRELWKEEYATWFRDEAEPEAALVRFRAFDAEYWDRSVDTGLRHVFHAARAYVSGKDASEPPQPARNSEAHAKLRLWAPSLPDS